MARVKQPDPIQLAAADPLQAALAYQMLQSGIARERDPLLRGIGMASQIWAGDQMADAEQARSAALADMLGGTPASVTPGATLAGAGPDVPTGYNFDAGQAGMLPGVDRDQIATLAGLPGGQEMLAQALAQQMLPPEAARPVTVGAGGALVDPSTGQIIHERPSGEASGFTLSPGAQRYDAQGNLVAEAPREPTERARRTATVGRHLIDVETGGVIFTAESEEAAAKLSDVRAARGDFDKASEPWESTVDAFEKIETSLKRGTAAGDMSGIFSFMKALDPSSTVREGEYASAQNTTGVPGWMLNYYNQAKDGTILNPQQRAEFRGVAGDFLGQQRGRQLDREARHREQAELAGIDPARVVSDRLGKYREWEPPAIEVPAGQAAAEQGFMGQLGDVAGQIGQDLGLVAPPAPARQPAPSGSIGAEQVSPIPQGGAVPPPGASFEDLVNFYGR